MIANFMLIFVLSMFQSMVLLGVTCTCVSAFISTVSSSRMSRMIPIDPFDMTPTKGAKDRIYSCSLKIWPCRAASKRGNVSLSSSADVSDSHIEMNVSNDDRTDDCSTRGAISMTVDELALQLGGWGRARLVWDYYRIGVDPLKHFGHVVGRPSDSMNDSALSLGRFVEHVELQDKDHISNLLPTSRKNQPLGKDALDKLRNLYANYGGSLEGGVARLSHVSKSKDGTTKLLIALRDGLEVETVIIPWFDKGWSTICIS